MRSEAPRERLRFFSNPRMPPERKSRTKPVRRTGAKPGLKTQMKPDRRSRGGTGGPPRKAAPSSQRTPPARPSAVAAAIPVAAAAAAEERRLRQRNRRTLEEDKPAVERCLEELVFGDVEDDEDALLRRLRGARVREASARAGRARAGRAVGGEAAGAEPGRPAAASAQVGGSPKRRRRGGVRAGPELAARAETALSPAPERAAEPRIQRVLGSLSSENCILLRCGLPRIGLVVGSPAQLLGIPGFQLVDGWESAF